MKLKIFTTVLFLLIIGYLMPGQIALATEGYKLSIPLPTEKVGEAPTTVVRGPAEYIIAIYRFGWGTALLLAMLMIVIGAIQYSISGGDTSKIADAKDRIFKAIWGVVLLLGAFLLLYTINPSLVSLRNPQLIFIKPPAPPKSKGVFETLDQVLSEKKRSLEEAKKRKEGVVAQYGENSSQAKAATIDVLKSEIEISEALLQRTKYEASDTSRWLEIARTYGPEHLNAIKTGEVTAYALEQAYLTGFSPYGVENPKYKSLGELLVEEEKNRDIQTITLQQEILKERTKRERKSIDSNISEINRLNQKLQ